MKTKKEIRLKKIVHPIFTAQLISDKNIISFDVRPTHNYLNQFKLIYRVQNPAPLMQKGVNLLTCQNQIPLIFNTRNQATNYIYNQFVNNL